MERYQRTNRESIGKSYEHELVRLLELFGIMQITQKWTILSFAYFQFTSIFLLLSSFHFFRCHFSQMSCVFKICSFSNASRVSFVQQPPSCTLLAVHSTSLHIYLLYYANVYRFFPFHGYNFNTLRCIRISPGFEYTHGVGYR